MASQDLMKLSAQTKHWIQAAIKVAKYTIGLEYKSSSNLVHLSGDFESDDIRKPEWTKLGVASGKVGRIVDFNHALTLAHSTFALYRAIEAWKTPENTEYSKVISVYLSIWWLFQGMLTLAYSFGKLDFVDFTTKTVKYIEENSAALYETSNKKWLVWAHWSICAGAKYGPRNFHLMLTAWAFLEPYSPTLVGSLLKDPENQGSPPVLHRLVSSAVVSYQQWHFALMAHLAVLTISAPLFNILVLDSRKRKELFSGSLGLTKSIRYYNQIHLVLRLFNNVFAPIMLPSAQVFLLLSCIFGFYGLIKFQGFVGITTGLIGLYCYWCIILLFKMPAEFHVRSRRYLALWNRLAEGDGLERRFYRSAKEWKIFCGSYCFIDEELILTISEMILGYVTNLLLLKI